MHSCRGQVVFKKSTFSKASKQLDKIQIKLNWNENKEEMKGKRRISSIEIYTFQDTWSGSTHFMSMISSMK